MISLAEFNRQIIQLPNLISILRLIIGFIIPFFVLSSSPVAHVLAVALFTFGSFTDRWDGQLAREMKLESNVGKYLDPMADKFFILGTLLAFSCRGFFSAWWLFPIFAREIIITFCRTGWLIEGLAVGAEMLGKIKLCLQVLAIFFCFFFLFLKDLGLGTSTAYFLMILSVMTATVMTIVSGYTFLLSNRALLKTPFFAKYTAAMGVGLAKKGPGTWGTLAALPIIFLTHHNFLMYTISFFIILLAGWWGVKQLNLAHDEDPGFCVTDEACGMMIALLFLPLNAVTVIGGFILFRLFDIFKPFPLRRLEKMHGYTGIVLDDLGAAVYTWLVLSLLILPFFG
jgi:CDP-diacylglycerol--glycerol-3-phosphate 3-phosphatidyltransferase